MSNPSDTFPNPYIHPTASDEVHPSGQKHLYHLVDPSAMPLLTSFAILAFVVGIAMTFHEYKVGPFLIAGGLLSIFACCFFWWRDVIREGLIDRAHTTPVRHGLRVGMALFIVSEVMFFAAFFWAYFHAALDPIAPLSEAWGMAKGVWPPKGIVPFDAFDLPFLNTLILLLSGTTVTWAHHALLEGNNRDVVRGLACTVFLGVCFTGLQAVEYAEAAFSIKDGIYPSTFYLATGFHGFHVMIGTIFLAVCLVRAKHGTLTPKGHLGFEFAAWYWHFVDVVWLFLFICIYWWGSAGYVPAAH